MKREFLYRHEKNCWTVELLSDGSIYATSNYKRQVNIQHRLAPYTLVTDSYGLIPDYVFNMLHEAHLVWKERLNRDL